VDAATSCCDFGPRGGAQEPWTMQVGCHGAAGLSPRCREGGLQCILLAAGSEAEGGEAAARKKRKAAPAEEEAASEDIGSQDEDDEGAGLPLPPRRGLALHGTGSDVHVGSAAAAAAATAAVLWLHMLRTPLAARTSSCVPVMLWVHLSTQATLLPMQMRMSWMSMSQRMSRWRGARLMATVGGAHGSHGCSCSWQPWVQLLMAAMGAAAHGSHGCSCSWQPWVQQP
jgi:hypothetical protein